MNPWETFRDKSRAQLIELAKELIKARLGKIDFQYYSEVSVWKQSTAYRVEFRAPVVLEQVNDRGNPLQDFVYVTVSEQQTVVTPQALSYLYKPTAEVSRIAKLFAPGESVRLTDNGASFEARVSRRSRSGMSGGSEAYSIDKKTLEKKMLWHEHPQAMPKMTISGGPPQEEWVEVVK